MLAGPAGARTVTVHGNSPVGTNLPAPQPPPRWRRPTLVMSGAACARCRWSYAVYRAARGRLLPVPDHVAQKIREGPWRPRDARARHHGPGSSLARHHANEEVGIARRDDCREDQDPRIFAQPVAELSFRSSRERRRWPTACSNEIQNSSLFAPKTTKNHHGVDGSSRTTRVADGLRRSGGPRAIPPPGSSPRTAGQMAGRMNGSQPSIHEDSDPGTFILPRAAPITGPVASYRPGGARERAEGARRTFWTPPAPPGPRMPVTLQQGPLHGG